MERANILQQQHRGKNKVKVAAATTPTNHDGAS
jgi:hypothetical protein